MTFTVKESMHFVEQKYKFQKNETEPKMENTTHSFTEKRTLSFSSYKNRKLKMELWWVEAPERKKLAFFVSFILSEENFL